MKRFQIKCETRKTTGKNASKKLRKNEQVPCVLYGGEKVIHFTAHENHFKKLIFTHQVYQVDLEIDDDNYQAIMQDKQFHPVTDKIIHVDFLQIFDAKPVKMKIPVRIVGDSMGIKEGGVMVQGLRYVFLKGLPADLPDFVEVDITDLDIGMSMKIGDLSFEKLEKLDSDTTAIVGISAPRSKADLEADIETPEDELEECELAEGEEGEEGEAAEGEEGEAAEGEGEGKAKEEKEKE